MADLSEWGAHLISLGFDLSGHLAVAEHSLHKLEQSSSSPADLPHACIVCVHLVHHPCHLLHLYICMYRCADIIQSVRTAPMYAYYTSMHNTLHIIMQGTLWLAKNIAE